MLRVFKMKLIMTFMVAVIMGDVSTKMLPMFYNDHGTVKMPQIFNIRNVTAKSKSTYQQEDLKNESSLQNKETSSDTLQDNTMNTNKQESIYSNSEVLNQIDNTVASSKVEEKNSINVIEKSNDTVEWKEEYHNIDRENQDSAKEVLEKEIPTIHYDRTTTIYDNDNITLLRVEYYINNTLTYYSVVEQFDATTKSYIEKIYQCNRETNIDPLVRTDVYTNGNLVTAY